MNENTYIKHTLQASYSKNKTILNKRSLPDRLQ